MRHRKNAKILNRPHAALRSLERDLATSLVLHGKIRTTEAKAKFVRPRVERLITSARSGTLAARRQLLSFFKTESAVKKMMDTIGPRYKERNGGYLRLQKLGSRRGDGAKMVLIEFC